MTDDLEYWKERCAALVGRNDDLVREIHRLKGCRPIFDAASPYQRFKWWLVMDSMDMLMSQHQLNFGDVDDGIAHLKAIRKKSSTSSIMFPVDFNPRDLKGHTPVEKTT